MSKDPTCRNCGAATLHEIIDLGHQPSANRLLAENALQAIAAGTREPTAPLRVMMCGTCQLAQLAEFSPAEDLFRSDYVYFSSYSPSWLAHAKRFTEMATARFGLDESSFVVEIASNDGYLLRNFVESGVPCLGVDPAKDAADAARTVGVDTRVDFFGSDLAKKIVDERQQADLIAGNNVFAHVPDINDFVAGLQILVAQDGVVSLEFPHLAQLISQRQFDTIYDEHFSYLSLHAVQGILHNHGLAVFDVEQLPTHGGSLRVLACRAESMRHQRTDNVARIIAEEQAMHLFDQAEHAKFRNDVERIRTDFISLIAAEKAQGRKIAAFGAAAKGNTFLNYCGIDADDISFVVDDTPAKQGKYLPGSHIPVVTESALKADRPDVVVILPWNFAADIKRKLAYIGDWGGRFVTAIPAVYIDTP